MSPGSDSQTVICHCIFRAGLRGSSLQPCTCPQGRPPPGRSRRCWGPAGKTTWLPGCALPRSLPSASMGPTRMSSGGAQTSRASSCKKKFSFITLRNSAANRALGSPGEQSGTGVLLNPGDPCPLAESSEAKKWDDSLRRS